MYLVYALFPSVRRRFEEHLFRISELTLEVEKAKHAGDLESLTKQLAWETERNELLRTMDRQARVIADLTAQLDHALARLSVAVPQGELLKDLSDGMFAEVPFVDGKAPSWLTPEKDEP